MEGGSSREGGGKRGKESRDIFFCFYISHLFLLSFPACPCTGAVSSTGLYLFLCSVTQA